MIWIPTAPVEVTPSGTPDSDCEGMAFSNIAVAARCLPGFDEVTTLTPHPDVQTVVDGVASALAAYDVRIVTSPPPEYLPTYALFTSADPVEGGSSYTCSSGSANCAGRGRDRAGFTNTGTDFCTAPDLLTSSMFAVGAMVGLEGKTAPDDWMNYPPNFLAPPTQFVDACGPIAPLLGGDDGMTPFPLQCTSADHPGCAAGEQNSHADLLAFLGPVTFDEDAPVITDVSPSDGDVVDTIDVEFTMQEASNYAGARLTISSDVLVGMVGVEDGRITFCTSELCDVNWLDDQPFKRADSQWRSGEIRFLPDGEYVIEIEASDYHGNEADTVTMTVTVGDGPVDPTAGSGGSGGSSGSGSGSTTGPGGGEGTTGSLTSAGASGGNATTDAPNPPDPSTATDSGSESTAGADDTVARGCSTGAPGPRAGLLLLMLLGLRVRRAR